MGFLLGGVNMKKYVLVDILLILSGMSRKKFYAANGPQRSPKQAIQTKASKNLRHWRKQKRGGAEKGQGRDIFL
jgi:hypothetical protein